MKLKNLLIISLVLVLAFLMVGCGTTYEDTNGDDDYSLQSITDDMFFGTRSSSSSGGTESELFGVYKKTCKQFNGIADLVDLSELTYYSDNAQITISFHITSGNAKLIICDTEKILAVVENNKDDQVISFDASDFAYLRLAGESLSYELEYCVAY